MTETRERLSEANVRIEKLIWIPGAIAAGCLPESLKDAVVDDLYDADNGQVLSKIPQLKPIMESDDTPDEDWIVEALYRADGFLAQLATPVPTSFSGDGNGHSFTWGYYQTKWVHADDMDELVKLAEEFGEQVVERARSNAGVAA